VPSVKQIWSRNSVQS